MKFQIGADPEIFVGKNGGVKSIIGLVGGTKEHPLPLLTLGQGFAVQEDNVAMEFNIPPSPDRASFVGNIHMAMEFLENAVRDSYGLQFVKSSAELFPKEELTDPRALVFGCDPDFNAWTGKQNRMPKGVDPSLRSCGGHIHIGYEEQLDKPSVIKAMDLYTGVPSILMDTGERRKQLYGKAGAFRPKSYGVEYRTLSNYWVFDKQLTAWVYDNTERALESVLNKFSFDDDAQNIQDAINNNNKDLAHHLVQKYQLNVL